MAAIRDLDPRPVVAMDWSFHGVHVTFDGETVITHPSVRDFVATLRTPHQICAEATFESWDHDQRQVLAREIRAAGHELYVFRPTHTARARGDLAKTDANDARVIYRVATQSRLHLYPLPAPDPSWVELRESANRDYQRLRLAGRKAELTAAAAAILGPYEDLDDETRVVLGNGQHYSDTLLAVTYFAASRSRGRAYFERLLGLQGSAHPSLLRSDLHHHCWRHASKRGVTWTIYRRVVRQTLAAYRAAGVIAPKEVA